MPPSLHDSEAFHALDNPIWNALSTSQISFSEGDGLARKFPHDVAPLSGLSEQSPLAYAALRQLAGTENTAALFLAEPPLIPPDWELTRTFEINQMIRVSPDVLKIENTFQSLSEADLRQMLELTKLTEPGPFRRRTIDLGTYLGVFSAERQLAAMAGERLKIPGFTEISAVCTHPDHRGKGYARALMSVLITNIQARGENPFLHVKADNQPAIKLYESLGFKFRRSFHLAVIKGAASRDQPGAA